MPRPKAVAVVAVHGVADQKPAESARAIASLLCNEKEFGSFAEVPLRIARERLDAGAPHTEPGLQYMHEQLVEYRDPAKATVPDAGAVYDTVRLEGERITDHTPVHVHEVYWADLSRAGDTWYRLLSEFYQLILHLPSLGRSGLRFAADAHGKTSAWRLALQLQKLAVWLLTVPAALVNLCLFSLGLIIASAEIAPHAGPDPRSLLGIPLPPDAVALVVGTVLLAAIPIVLLRALAPRPVLWFSWLPITGAAAVAAWKLVAWRHNSFEVLAAEAALLAAGACIYVTLVYKKMKGTTAVVFGVPCALVTAGTALYFIIGKVHGRADAYVAAVDAGQHLYPLILITWALIFTAAIAAAVAGLVAVRTTPRGKRYDAWRATWTARFSLGMPAAIFVIFTLSLWFLFVGAIEVASKDLTGNARPMLAAWHPLGYFLQVPDGTLPVDKLLERFLMNSALGFEFFVGALGVFLLAALFAAVPSVIAELRHPRGADDAQTLDLGRWLSRGIRVVAAAAETFTIALLLVPVEVLIVRLSPNRVGLIGDEHLRVLLGATAAGIALLLTSKYFIGSFRAAVDVLLDVDNYMRESPRNATPRARIAERYVSLLRHLCEWRDADGQPYARIVLVAHSQGTVISADVLRYLNARPDARLKLINDDKNVNHIPLRLYTMGSPLRQIYTQAFPHLYNWVTDPNIAAVMTAPDPTTLTLERWSNIYRSGDYVGRNLWVPKDAQRLWTRAHAVPQPVGGRVDFCAGAGAHTHYWNENGKEVVDYLKTLLDA